MGFQKLCQSCGKSVWITTVDGNYSELHRCPTCGFQIRIPPKKNTMKSADYGD